ncbi:MAG: hypothetical protein ACYC0B_02035 [Gemmatimonadaceae bacterium]
MATELSATDFAEAIGVKVADLPALERAGLPFVNRKKDGRVYPLPRALTWFVDHAVTTRVGGIPPRTKQKDLAALVGYSPRQISNLVDDGKVKTVVEGGHRLYPLPDAVHAIIAHREEQARGKSGEKMTALDEAKLRKMQADAEASELTVMQRRGELLDRVLVERAISELFQAIKAQLVQFTPRYEADLVDLETRVKVRGVLKPAVNAEITRLASAVAQVGRRIQMIDAENDADPDEDENEEGDDADAS